MGLPLFIPPVESDTPSKSPAKPPADSSHGRSPIRRDERRRQIVEAREQRLRMLTAASNTPSLSLALSGRPPHPRFAEPRRALRVHSPGPEDDSELHQYLERRRRRARVTNNLSDDLVPDDPDNSYNELSQWAPSHVIATVASAPDAVPSERPRYGLLGLASARVPAPSSRRGGIEHDFDIARHIRRRLAEGPTRSLPIDYLNAIRRHTSSLRYVYLDGLADRDHSLSPERDGAWDTLQSTLAPDPQPPSLGSSFASATASFSMPQTSGDNPVNTSMTTQNEETEQPCDPVPNNPGSDDDVEQQPDSVSQQPGPPPRPAFAHPATDTQSNESAESLDTNDPEREWLSGMHRIVRALASRADIPDEWWAQAGLSRSISWGDSN
ncbi:hypothetical protein GGS21DRAFT_525696 [Xylaria nigripes]|nr:hypothetical protein GGS21DRAFT_525696 [Xylaria nigripes]